MLRDLRAEDAEEVRSRLTQGLIDPADIRVLEQDGCAVGYVARRGNERVRSSFEMVIDLEDEPPPPPARPDGVEVRTYPPDEDERVAYETQEDAFYERMGMRVAVRSDSWDRQL